MIIFQYWRAILVAVLFMAVIGSYFYGKNEGIKIQTAVYLAEASKTTDQGRNTNDTITQEVMQSSTPDLDSRLSRWLR